MTDASLSADMESWGSRLQWSMASLPLGQPVAGLSEYVSVFHEWIRQGTTGDLLIDVASYEHVPEGPGVLLVGDEVDYSLAERDGCLILTCRHKRSPRGAAPGLARCLSRLLSAGALLQGDRTLSEAPRFCPQELTLQSNDRLLLPNDRAAWSRLEPQLRQIVRSLLDVDVAHVRSVGESRERLTLRVGWAPAAAADAGVLRDRIALALSSQSTDSSP